MRGGGWIDGRRDGLEPCVQVRRQALLRRVLLEQIEGQADQKARSAQHTHLAFDDDHLAGPGDTPLQGL